MYLALNRRGQPRKVLIRAQQQLGKLSTYTRVLTQPVSPERVDELMTRLAQAHAHSNGSVHPLRHHGSAAGGHLCATVAQQQQRHALGAAANGLEGPGVDRLRCRRRKKRKKKRRKCQPHEEELPCPERPPKPKQGSGKPAAPKNATGVVECDGDKDECQRIHSNDKLVNKKNGKKTRVGEKQLRVMKKKSKKTGKTGKKGAGAGAHKLRTTSTTTTERQQELVTSEEDYSSRATSSAASESEEGSAAGAASWEEPFVPPYPTSTAPPQ